ncbi:uncharacterized protein LOC143542436 [Bidens hawaiensis]|uniref:uncharacterized protein LOC143542436 n=1 Tax=Bidens hawaiensis TaxID=980011 RepID=UPI00404A0A97
MAHRAANLLKSMVNRSRSGSLGFATSTSPKLKAFSPTADHAYHHHHQYPKPKSLKGDYVPVYISLGLILMSVSIGTYTATHQLKRSPNVFVRKSKRETLPELVEPEKVAQESAEFINKSFFRKIAHVQDADRQDIMADPIRGDTCAMHQKKPYVESLKSVGVEVEKKPFVEPPPLKH